MKGICPNCNREFGGELIGVACPDCGKEVVEHLGNGVPAGAGKFKVGDVVYLMSGGPAMTVLAIGLFGASGNMVLGWFTDGLYGTAVIPEACCVDESEIEVEGDEEEDFEGN